MHQNKPEQLEDESFRIVSKEEYKQRYTDQSLTPRQIQQQNMINKKAAIQEVLKENVKKVTGIKHEGLLNQFSVGKQER